MALKVMKSPPDSSMERLRQAKAVLRAVENDLAGTRAQLEKTRSEYEDDLLDSRDPGQKPQLIVALELKVSGLEAALRKAKERVRQLRSDLCVCLADESRKKASVPRREWVDHKAEIDKALSQVEKLTGFKFVAADPDVARDGAVSAPVLYPGFHPLLYSMDKKLMRLQKEVERFNREAEQHETDGARALSGGRIITTDTQELFKASDDILELAPARPAIEAWLQQATQLADRQWEALLSERKRLLGDGAERPARRLTYTLAWDGTGEILPTSAVENRAVLVPLAA